MTPKSNTRDDLIQEVVDQEKKAGDDRVGLILLDYPAAHLTGCYQHFDHLGQRQVGDELAKALREKMGWEELKSK